MKGMGNLGLESSSNVRELNFEKKQHIKRSVEIFYQIKRRSNIDNSY